MICKKVPLTIIIYISLDIRIQEHNFIKEEHIRAKYYYNLNSDYFYYLNIFSDYQCISRPIGPNEDEAKTFYNSNGAASNF
jgi:hypothetical protein